MMRLYVYVLEARGLPPSKGRRGTYAKLKAGRHKARTRAVRGTGGAVWDEEFVFGVGGEDEVVEVRVLREDEGVLFGSRGGELIGRVRLSVRTVFEEGKRTLPPTWFPLKPKKRSAGSKSTALDCGKILITLSLYVRSNGDTASRTTLPLEMLCKSPTVDKPAQPTDVPHDSLTSIEPSAAATEDKPASDDKPQSVQALAGRLVQKLLNKSEESSATSSRNHDSSDPSDISYGDGRDTDNTPASPDFYEAIEILESRDKTEVPENLRGGILLEETYNIDTKDLNSFLFEPGSQFRRDLADLEGTTDYQEGAWTWKCEDMTCLRRSVTYTKAATKLVKAVEAMEEQTYLKADGKCFSVLTCVSTPGVPYGNCFEVDLLYKVITGQESASGEQHCSHLVISWEINFQQSTIMKSVIEGTAQQGLKESYERFARLLAQNIEPGSSEELPMDKDRLLAPLQEEHNSEGDLAIKYFCNFTAVSTIFMCVYVLVHIVLSVPSSIQGLEFIGLDLPDTFGELITCGILILSVQRVFNMIKHFAEARLSRGSDHGVKAQGDGWLLTIALIEGSNLPSSTSSESSDPYVVFSCNGQTRTSSVQLQTLNPQWTEILEFDAMQEPPSMLDVEIFDFDGPFDLSFSLGHAEINFLKHTSAELADMWIDLEGKMSQASKSQLHIRIFLENSKGVEVIREYLTKMEKEVGKKLSLRSPHRNSTFQKTFLLPPEEFLISDFSCYLKRKLPLQGRLFLSARIVGFYANLFGHKTKFFFLWEDIEDMQVLPPSLATVGSPALLIILKIGRGLDARHGAKSQDEEGRLIFQFQTFVPFNVAARTIMALWRTRASAAEQKAPMEEDQHEQDGSQIKYSETFLSNEDNALSKTFSAELPIPMNIVMDLFRGTRVEKKIMEKVGCLNYLASPWRAVMANCYERHVNYKFSRHVSIFGGDVTSAQKKTSSPHGDGWIIDEVMSLHNVPFGDHFHINLRYKFQSLSSSNGACKCEVYVGVTWIKSSKFQKRITKNICDKLTHRSKEIFEFAEREILSAEESKDVT